MIVFMVDYRKKFLIPILVFNSVWCGVFLLASVFQILRFDSILKVEKVQFSNVEEDSMPNGYA